MKRKQKRKSKRFDKINKKSKIQYKNVSIIENQELMKETAVNMIQKIEKELQNKKALK